jgi:branched-chain amino acid aminotransferase
MIECFGSGTAVIVCPVNNINYNDKNYAMPINEEIGAGNLTKKILDMV